jgi:hypothetical protein
VVHPSENPFLRNTLDQLRDLRQPANPLATNRPTFATMYHAVADRVVRDNNADAAPTPAAARQLADATAIAALAVGWWRFPALVGHPNYAADARSATESARLLVDEVAPARRDDVAPIVNDTRLDDALEAQASRASLDPALTPLAAERQSRLVALALDILATPPAAPATDVDPDLVHAARSDGLRVLDAGNREMWALLVGDAGELAAARARVDDAVATARPSRDRLREAAGGELVASALVDRPAGQALDARSVLDDTGDPVKAAWAMLAAMETEARALEAAGELGSTEQWRRASVIDAMAAELRHLTLAGAFALRRLDNAPGDHAGGVDAALWADLARRRQLDDRRFNGNATGDERATWRALSDTSPVADLVKDISRGGAPIGDGRPWTVQRDVARGHLESTAVALTQLAG